VIQLQFSDGLSPFGPGFARAALAVTAMLVTLWLAGIGLMAFGSAVRALTMVAIFWPLLWLGLRFGLEPGDKAALGKLGRKLGL
jgi:hypothetical protein